MRDNQTSPHTHMVPPMTYDEVEEIILRTEPPGMSDRDDEIWTRRMAVCLADLFNKRLAASATEGQLTYDMRLRISKALDRLVCDDSTPEQVDTFIQTFSDFGLQIVADSNFSLPSQTKEDFNGV